MEHSLILLHPSRPTFPGDATAVELGIVGQHLAYLRDLARRGEVVLAGRTDESAPVGIVVVKGPTEHAEFVGRHDPAVRAGLMNMETRRFLYAVDGETIRATPPS